MLEKISQIFLLDKKEIESQAEQHDLQEKTMPNYARKLNGLIADHGRKYSIDTSNDLTHGLPTIITLRANSQDDVVFYEIIKRAGLPYKEGPHLTERSNPLQ